MPKRKLKEEVSAELSDLSPPPAGLLDEQIEEQDVDEAIKGPASKRRKTKQIKSETIVDGRGKEKASRVSRKQTVTYKESDSDPEEPKEAPSLGQQQRAAKTTKKTKVTAVKKELSNGVVEKYEVPEKKVIRKRKTKEEKEAEAMPLALRTAGHKLFIGAHVSASGGNNFIDGVLDSVHMLKHTRRSECCRQQRSYRRECFCTFPEKPAEMGQPTSCRRRRYFFP